MRLLWRLLSRHITVGQFVGFAIANLLGMTIVLLSVQLYNDIKPLLSGSEAIMRDEYMVVSKKVSALRSLAGSDNSFSDKDIEEIESQPFVKSVGVFSSSQFEVSAGIDMRSRGGSISSDIFFESVDDRYIDVDLKKWHFTIEEGIIPIIMPRNYLNIYNFGFSQSHNLPKVSEGMISAINLDILLEGQGKRDRLKGNIVGFSNRLNTILVPGDFMSWANEQYGSEQDSRPSRIIVEVENPSSSEVALFFKDKNYDVEGDMLSGSKSTYLLRIVMAVVFVVGLVISLLSLYILMLSIFLLVEKNSDKLQTLLLIGYSYAKVSLPYQLLSIGLNTVILTLSLAAVVSIRGLYINLLGELFVKMQPSWLLPTILVGIALALIVSSINYLAIRSKVRSL